MKKQISRTLLGFFAVLVLAAGAQAQTSRGMEIEVPFDFVAGGKQLPAGSYTVRRVRGNSESMLVIKAERGGAAAIVLTNTGERNPEDASLTFRQHGERYFLAAVSMPGTASVRELAKTGAERAAEREMTEQAEAGAGASKTVTVAGSIR